MQPSTQAAQPRANPIRGLIALNAALLIILAVITFSSIAKAQARGRGEYTMVAGGVPGSDSAAIYIADVSNQELVIMTYNPQTKVLDGVGYRHLAQDAANVARNRRPSN